MRPPSSPAWHSSDTESVGAGAGGSSPDFLIGAHAAIAGYRVRTRDPRRYRSYDPTPELRYPDWRRGSLELGTMRAPRDTLDDAWARQIAAFRAMRPEDRVQLALRMSEEVRDIALAGIRTRHPEWTAAQVQAELEDLTLGIDVARTARAGRLAPPR